MTSTSENDHMNKTMQADKTSDTVRSYERAVTLRNEGNKMFVEKSYFDALLKYNESLCYAERGSEAIGLAYANRSAVYYELKLYEKCLQNIELARNNGYPRKNIQILDKRTEKCLQQIEIGCEIRKDDNPFDFIRLPSEINKKLPFVSNSLELRRNDKFGRYIVTNRDLKVGEIVAIEEPYFKTIKTDDRYDGCERLNKYQRCAFCLKSNLLDLIPCATCSVTMYCSDQCLTNALKDYHSYECPIVDSLHKSGVMQMAMLVFFKALSIFDGSITDLEKTFNDNESSSHSVYDFDFADTDNNQTNGKNYLISLLCLARNDKDYRNDSPEKLFHVHPKLSGMWTTHEAFIRKFILKVLQIGDSNFHGICGWSLRKYDQVPQMIGIGCYPFISLVNHGCAPNVNRIYVEDKMMLLVERPIRKGEQLFDCYKNTFFTQPKADRQLILLDNYGFLCDCIACTNEYPVFHRLKSVDRAIYKDAKKGKAELLKLGGSEAKKRFRIYCDTIQKHHDIAFPSAEIVVLQECILQCISIVIKPNFVIP